MFDRYDDGTVVIMGKPPAFTTMTWEFIQGSDPDLVTFSRDQVTFLGQATYVMTGINKETGTVDMELIVWSP